MFAHTNIINFLDIPTLDHTLTKEIVDRANALGPDLESIAWLEHFHDHNIQAVSQIYARDAAIFSPELQNKIQQFYQPYFLTPVIPIFGVFENTYKDYTAECPPHCDRYRKVAVNYIIQTGGSNVLTCFYKNRRTNSNLETAENSRYENVILDFKIRLPEQIWHTYDVQTYHSVENIETKRIILSLYLENNLNYNDFIESHKQLLYE
jgi:hypothetical protein